MTSSREQFNDKRSEERKSETEKKVEKFLALTEQGLIYDGVKIDRSIRLIKSNLEEARKHPEKKYHSMYREELYTVEEIEKEERNLEEKKKQWEIDCADYLHEKALRGLGKGKELDEKTSLIFDKTIKLISEKVKEGSRMFILTEDPFNGESVKARKLYQMPIQDLEKEARRSAVGEICQNLSKEEIDSYEGFFDKNFNDLLIKVRQE